MICQSWKVMFQAEYSSGQPLRLLVDLRAVIDTALATSAKDTAVSDSPAPLAKAAVAAAGSSSLPTWEVSGGPAVKGSEAPPAAPAELQSGETPRESKQQKRARKLAKRKAAGAHDSPLDDELWNSSRELAEKRTLDQPTILIVSDEAEFSGAVTGRWQAEREIPAFTLMRGDLCRGLDPETYDAAVVGPVRRGGLPGVLKALAPAGGPVLLVCQENQTPRGVRESHPRIMVLRQYDGWLDALVLVLTEALRRCEAQERAQRAEQANATLQQQAALGSYILEMRHSLNNALTSVLGNSELLLSETELPAAAHSQLETIRDMCLRMHEVLQRFSSLEKELKVGERQAEKEGKGRARAKAAGAP
jgi:K+-sensing histidine kinase KdpD